MSKYAIWDKKTDVFTPSNRKFTAAEWLAEYPWAGIEGVKMIITAGVINGGCAMEFEATKEFYARLGVTFTDDMTDEEVLAAIEEFENRPQDTTPSAEERIAAALEYQTLASLPDEEV